MNEFKFSTLRQFGSENISFTSTIHSDSPVLSEEQIAEQIAQFDKLISKAFVAVCEREIAEKEILIATSERRAAAVARHDAALKDEMAVRKEAEKTLQNASKKQPK